MSGRYSRCSAAAVLALALSPAAVAVTPPGDEAASPDRAVVAVWDGGRLEQDALRAWAAWQGLDETDETVRKLVLIESMSDAARSAGLADSAEVDLAIESRRQQTLLPLLERHVNAGVTISDAEIEHLREQYPDAFQRPRKLLLRTVYKRLPDEPAAREAVRAHMAALRERVVAGADIGALAATESESQTRYRDGRIGFVAPGELPPAVAEAVGSLEAGGVSDLVEHAGGVSFFQCERVRPAVVPTPDEVRTKLRNNLYNIRRREHEESLKTRLAAGVRVAPGEDPVLVVGDYALPAERVDDLARQRLPDRDPDTLSPRQRRRLLQEWGLRVALADHAESLGLVEPERLAQIMRWHRDHALASAELRRRVDARLSPGGDDELRALFDERGDRLRNPDAYRLAAIQFATADAVQQPGVVERARAAMGRIRAGELDFEAAAREFSIHRSAPGGGVLGWLTRRQIGSLDVRLLAPVRELEPGADTGLLRTESGLWVVKLLDYRPPSPKTFEQAREVLEQIHRQRRIAELEDEVRRQQLRDIGFRPGALAAED